MDESAALFKKGVEHHNRGRYKKAIKMYEETLRTYGLDKKVLVLLGNAYYMTKNYEKARESYDAALSLDPNYSMAHFNLGIFYEERGELERAEKAYKRAIELEPEFAMAHSNLADVYRAQGRIEDAVLHYKKALELDPELEDAVKGLGQVPREVVERVEKEEALKRCDELLRRGIEEERRGEYGRAEQLYHKALSVYPESPAAPLLLSLLPGSSRERLEKTGLLFLRVESRLSCEALSMELREFLGEKLGGVELDDASLETFFDRLKEVMKGRKKLSLGDAAREVLFEEPKRELEKALELELKGEEQAAEEAYEKVVERAPYLVHNHLMYGLFLERAGREEEALSRYREACRWSSGYLDGERGYVAGLFSRRPGYEYLSNMDVVSILREFLKAAGGEDGMSLHRFIRYKLSMKAEERIRYGFAREELGEVKEAITAYEDAATIDPANPIVHYVLGLAYESRGLVEEAMAEYEKTRGADFRGIESSEDISSIIDRYLSMTTKDGHRVGTILGRYFEIIAQDPEQMLELLGFIEDLKIEGISRIIKSYISSDVIFGGEGRVVRDQKDFGEDLDDEEEKMKRAGAESKVSIELVWKYKTQRSIRCHSCTSDGKAILAGSENGIVYYIDSKAFSPWRHEARGSITDVSISPRGRYGVLCDSEGVMELLDCLRSGRSLWRRRFKKGGLNSVAVSELPAVAASTYDLRVLVYDKEGEELESYSFDEMVRCLDMTEDGETLLAACDTALYLIKLGEGALQLKPFPHGEVVQSASISGDGGLIAASTRAGNLYLLDAMGGLLWRKELVNPVYGVAVASTGSVAAGTMNGGLMVYSAEGELLWRYQTGENIWDVGMSGDGAVITAGCGLVFGNVYLFERKEAVDEG